MVAGTSFFVILYFISPISGGMYVCMYVCMYGSRKMLTHLRYAIHRCRVFFILYVAYDPTWFHPRPRDVINLFRSPSFQEGNTQSSRLLHW